LFESVRNAESNRSLEEQRMREALQLAYDQMAQTAEQNALDRASREQLGTMADRTRSAGSQDDMQQALATAAARYQQTMDQEAYQRGTTLQNTALNQTLQGQNQANNTAQTQAFQNYWNSQNAQVEQQRLGLQYPANTVSPEIQTALAQWLTNYFGGGNTNPASVTQ
jgi:hypothetical protein